ncbi:MAG: methyltransferase [Gemmatimonadaceae bacterium]
MSYSLVAKRLRLPLGFLFAALYLAFARPTPEGLLLGGTVAFAGLLIRAWASGHIMKNDRLATTGPYGHTRNPLYLGSFLISCGFALAAHWLLLAVVAVFFALIYAPTMAREKANILGRFPDTYPDFERNVPAFFPRFTPWQSAERVERGAFSPALYVKHGEWKAALGYVGAMTWLILRLRGYV